ncbi:MAG: hypothetical protein GY732_01695 [Gammaproteobacteria bacterium]|nr:hypothetical protein [Gammaproteobacteria bacterium]
MSNLRMLFLDDMEARHKVIDEVAHIWDITHTYDARGVSGTVCPIPMCAS